MGKLFALRQETIAHALKIYFKNSNNERLVTTGRSDRYGRTLFKNIEAYFKKQHDVVSIEKFCT